MAKRAAKAEGKYGYSERLGRPRKQPGRKKRTPQHPNSKRKPKPIEQRLDEACDELALKIISGESIEQCGSTGKAVLCTGTALSSEIFCVGLVGQA